MIVVRKFEHNDVAPADRAIWQQLFVPSTGAFQNELVHQHVIAYQQRRLHGLRRNFEGLHDESGDEQRKKNGDEKRFGILG